MIRMFVMRSGTSEGHQKASAAVGAASKTSRSSAGISEIIKLMIPHALAGAYFETLRLLCLIIGL